MKISVCAKLVPAADNVLKISESGDTIADKGRTLVIDDCDEYAIEEALTLKEAHGGEVDIITVGSLRSQDVLYPALAKGADRGIRIDSEAYDSETVAELLTRFFKKHQFDLILTGIESSDNSSATTGVSIAERLGIPHAMAVTKIDLQEGGTVKVHREFREGSRIVMELPIPALLCVQSGIQELTYVSLTKLLKARQRPVQSFGLADLELDADKLGAARKVKTVQMFFRESEKPIEILKGEPIEVAHQLLGKMKVALA